MPNQLEARTITAIRDAITMGTYREATAALLEFQIAHYSARLEEETRVEVKSFIRNELFNLKKRVNE